MQRDRLSAELRRLAHETRLVRDRMREFEREAAEIRAQLELLSVEQLAPARKLQSI